MSRSIKRRGFTMAELLVLVVIITILVALLLPALSGSREGQRRAQCVNNLKQIGLAIHNYHAAYECFPPMRCGTGASGDPQRPTILDYSNGDQLSGWVLLLPYLEQNPLYLQIVRGGGTPAALPWGPVPEPAVAPVWDRFAIQVPALLCPTDDGGQRKLPGEYGRTNYVFCLGDSLSNNDWLVPDPVTGSDNFKPPRGIFGWHTATRIADILDGTSNTIAASERAIGLDPKRIRDAMLPEQVDEQYGPARCMAYAGPGGMLATEGVLLSGLCWANGHASFAGFTTCLPPNAPSCGRIEPAGYAKSGSGGIYSASGRHRGGVNCILADGSVRFIGDSIDTGDLNLSEAAPIPGAPNGQTSTSPSRWGVWGALGSKASGEQLGAF